MYLTGSGALPLECPARTARCNLRGSMAKESALSGGSHRTAKASCFPGPKGAAALALHRDGSVALQARAPMAPSGCRGNSTGAQC